jgi:DNA-binding transcriptional LysR family regulator
MEAMEIRQLQYFVTLAEIGNYLRASEELYVSQSQLSKKLMRLEEELGVPLIDRTRRQIALTPAGEAALEGARAVLAAHAGLLSDLGPFQSPPVPPLRILSIPVLAAYRIPGLLADFHKASPAVEVQLVEREANEILRALEAGDADLGLVREGFVDTGRFDRIRFCADDIVVLVARNHPLAGPGVVALERLRRESFVFPDRQTLLFETYANLCRSHGFEPSVVHTSLHQDNLVEMVASGAGVALMMRAVAALRPDPRVAVLDLEKTVPSYLVAAWPKARSISPGGRAFVRFLEPFSHSCLE